MKSVSRILVILLFILFCSEISLASTNQLVQINSQNNDKNVITSPTFDPNDTGQTRTKNSRKKGVLIKFTKSAEKKRARGKKIRGLKRFKKKNKLRLKKLSKGIKKKRKHGKKRKSKAGLERWHKLELPDNVKEEDAIKLLEKDPDIEYVEPNFVQTISLTPNDPAYSSLWGMNSISAPEAWSKETGSAHVIVAVIDTGVDYGHEDLKANMWRNFSEIPNNRIDDDGNGYIDDVYGYDFVNNDGDPKDDNAHGTHVAGTIAAKGNNSTGVVGVDWNTRIMALKSFSGFGSGFTEDSIKAIEYAVANGAHVINASWGGAPYSQALKDAIDAANELLFVAAAGNSAENTDDLKHYPSSYDSQNILSVAALRSSSSLASFSNYGSTSVDIAAPGQDIFSTVPTAGCQVFQSFFGPYDYCDPSGYSKFSGTSMASPHVAGAAALLKSFAPELSAIELKQALLNSVDKKSALIGKVLTEGSLNISSAIENNLDFKRKLEFKLLAFELNTSNSESYTIDLFIKNNSSNEVTLQLQSNIPNNKITLNIPDSIKLSEFESITLPVKVQINNNLPKEGYQILISATDTNNNRYHTQLFLDHDAPDFQYVVQSIERRVSVGSSSDYIFNILSNEYSGDVRLDSLTKIDGLSVTFTPNEITLSPGIETQFVATFSADESVTYGLHRMYFQATDGNTVRNVDFNIGAYVPGIDLIMKEFWIPPKTPIKLGWGNGIESSITVSNYGMQKSNDQYLGIFLSKDPIIDSSDIIIRGWRFPLESGGIAHGHPILSSENDIPSGQYYIGAITDYRENNAEYSENNNVSEVLPIEVINDTDIIIESINFPSNPINSGELITVPFTLSNIGTVALNQRNQTIIIEGQNKTRLSSTVVDFYLSDDQSINTNDTLIGRHVVENRIGGGEMINDIASFIISVQNTTSGTQYIGAIVNGDKFRLEKNYENNVSKTSSVELIKDVDLVARTLVIDAPKLNLNTRVNALFTLQNMGTTNVDKVRVNYYLSKDNTLNIYRDKLINYSIFENLGGGVSKDGKVSFFASSSSLSPGKYYLFASIDPSNSIQDEKDKTNNIAMSEAFEIVGDTDVYIQSINYDTAVSQPGDIKLVDVTIGNQGSNPLSDGVTLEAFLSKDRILSEDDYSISTSFVSNSLAEGSLFDTNISIVLPNVPSNDYHIIFSIKTKPEWYETNIDNNHLAGGIFSLYNYDINLQITDLSTTQKFDGSSFDVSYAIKNTGFTDATAFEISYYLSSDLTISDEDTFIGSSRISSLAGNTTASGTQMVSIPDALPVGDYYLGAIVDSNNAIAETNENDNTKSSSLISLSREIDLSFEIASVDKQKVKVGDSLTVSYSITNTGDIIAQNAFVYIYFGNTYIDQFSVTEIPAGQQTTGTYLLTLSDNLPTGLQELKLIVDGNNSITESNEENNTFVIPDIELISAIDPVVNADVCHNGCEFASIQAAIDATLAGGKIQVAAGTYYEAIVMGDDKVLLGIDGPENTIIDATDLDSSVIKLVKYGAHIEGFTLRGGKSENGGGIYINFGVVTIDNNIIRDNVATNGGAIGGGGGYTQVKILNSTITNNVTTGYYGTVSVGNSQLLVRGNIFSFNEVSNGIGGGLVLGGSYSATRLIDRNIFRGNSAAYGGAIYVESYTPGVISNTLMVENSAKFGAAIFGKSYSFGLRIISSTIADNNGDAIYTQSYGGRNWTMENSIVYGNSGNSFMGERYSYSTKKINSITSDDVDPMFIDSTAGNYRLSSGSPAIDTGGDINLINDLDGNARPLDGDGLGAGETGDGSDYDMGAYEFVNFNQ